ncbi:hypothetical protein [Clostridium paraputrificum]|uniref:Uncharacterized protein n=1 Tax=Clostridium paraputrificum TaxID=29363 RepID=A0A6N3FCL7_9CLOT
MSRQEYTEEGIKKVENAVAQLDEMIATLPGKLANLTEACTEGGMGVLIDNAKELETLATETIIPNFKEAKESGENYIKGAKGILVAVGGAR